MKIVVELEDYQYGHCVRHVEERYASIIEEAVVKGTVLPEGHGRLIDAGWLKGAIHNFFNGLMHPVDEVDIQSYIDATPTVIEADREGK